MITYVFITVYIYTFHIFWSSKPLVSSGCDVAAKKPVESCQEPLGN